MAREEQVAGGGFVFLDLDLDLDAGTRSLCAGTGGRLGDAGVSTLCSGIGGLTIGIRVGTGTVAGKGRWVGRLRI